MFETIRVRREESACFIQLHRPDANNTINATLIAELHAVLAECRSGASIVVLEGLPEVFCSGADFQQIAADASAARAQDSDPGLLYDLWEQMATGPYVTISHVRGKVNAGGVGFVAASDIVLADSTAQFSLSEMLFGLYPACVLPFLIRRVGFQRAHYLTLTTQAVSVEKAHGWGLVDAWDVQGEVLLRKHLLRLRCLSKEAIRSYKEYMNELHPAPAGQRAVALEGNRRIFSDPRNIAAIARYVKEGLLPWER